MADSSKGKLLFIPTYDYLSNPLFFSLIPQLCEFSLLYFDTDEFRKIYISQGSVLSVVSSPINDNEISEIKKHFDKYYKVELPQYFVLTNLLQIIRECKNIIKQIKIFKKYCDDIYDKLNRIKPLAIITTSDFSISLRMSQKWAKKNCIPFILLQPSFFDVKRRKRRGVRQMCEYIIFNYFLNIPKVSRQSSWGNEDKDNYVLVWGEHFKNLFKGEPIYDHVYVLGSPKFSFYFNEDYKNEESKKKIYSELRITPDKKIITICTDALESLTTDAVLGQLNGIYKMLIRKKKDLFFLIKLHPRDEAELYQKIFLDCGIKNYKIVKEVSLVDVYKITDVQVSVMSVSSFEAVIAGIPIILINPDNKIGVEDHFFKNKIELRAQNYDELLLAIEKALSNEYREQEFMIKREKYLREMIYQLDDRAEERIAYTIKKIIREEFGVIGLRGSQ